MPFNCMDCKQKEVYIDFEGYWLVFTTRTHIRTRCLSAKRFDTKI